MPNDLFNSKPIPNLSDSGKSLTLLELKKLYKDQHLPLFFTDGNVTKSINKMKNDKFEFYYFLHG